MSILVTGASGMIGTALCERMDHLEIPYQKLSRKSSGSTKNHVYWNPEEQVLESEKLHEVETVIHLAGENVGQRWTRAVKRRILTSRRDASRFLFEKLAAKKHPPKPLITASGIGFYGSAYNTLQDENSLKGEGFLADVVEAWESAVDPLKNAGARLVFMRQGLVLSPSGGALAKMLPFFQFGLGGNLGSGQQIMSWIVMEDMVRAIMFFHENESQSGIFNLVSPNPVSNVEFTAMLGGILKRPTLFPVPALALRALYGEMAMQTMLSSQKVKPNRLIEAGFEFKYPKLEEALRQCLGREK